MSGNKVDNRKLRSFGLVVGVGFAVIALVPALRGHNPRMWAMVVSIVLAATGLVAPSALKPFHRVWMTLGEMLGWVNSRIILSVLYYLLIVPIGALQRMSGSDPMRRKIERNAMTYKIPRKSRPASHMMRQY